MASDIAVGDIETPTLTVVPGDNTTAGTLTVTAPDGTTTTPAVTAGTVSQGTRPLTAAAVTYNQPGKWVRHWTITGTGAGAEYQVVYVVASPVAGGPTWTPGRSRVANYVPGRTLVRAAGANTAALTFDSTTCPPGIVVDRLIADGVAWVLAATGTVHASLYDMAAATCAVWAAAMVEQGYPDREAAVKQTSTDIAAALLAQARSMRADLVTANTAAGEAPVDAGASLLPRWSFPAPPAWGDVHL